LCKRQKSQVPPVSMTGHSTAPFVGGVDRLERRVGGGGFFAASPPQIPFIQSGRNKFSQSFLLKCCRLPVAQPLGRRECLYQLIRSHQISDPQSRKYRPGKCSDVNDSALRIESLQRLKRLSVVTKLPIVVVLDN